MEHFRNEAFIAADFGNSRVKLLIIAMLPGSPEITREYISYSYSLDIDWIERIEEIFNKFSGNKINFTYSSVNITKLETLLSRLGDIRGIRLRDAGDLIDSSAIIDFEKVEGMGIDRKLGLLGALTYLSSPFITIDAGTAITINVLGKGNICLGGAIMPGIYTQIKSLAESATGLQAVGMSQPIKTTASTTREALRSGILVGAFGAIKEITKRISAEEFDGFQIPVIAAGGAVELLEPYLAEHFSDFRVCKNLVLDGIEYLCK